jgi:protein gp37
MRQAGGFLSRTGKYAGLTAPSKAGPVWTGEVRLWEPALDQPLRWTKPRRIFVNSMSDLFHEALPHSAIRRVFGTMRDAPQHTYQILTKRADRMQQFVAWWVTQYVERPPANWWLGVSVEGRARLGRIEQLRATPAAIRFLSLEPLLEDLVALDLSGIDWVIVGGESGPGARPMHPDWVRRLRDQCLAAEVPFFFKQWGEWAPAPEHMNYAEGAALACRRSREFEQWSSGHTLIRVGKHAAGRLLDGREWDEYPRGSGV